MAAFVALSSLLPLLCANQKMNVMLLVTDDMRPETDFWTPGAQAKTPYLDKLAAKSLVLQSNYVQQAVCGPTRASFLTGRRPDTLRTVTQTRSTYWRVRAGNFSSLPQMFKENGWHTVSFGKVFDLRTSSHNKGDGLCDNPYSWSEPPVFCGTVTWVQDGKMGKSRSHAVLTDEQEKNHSDVVIMNAALERYKAGLPSPWLLAIGAHRPHLPFLVPQRFVDMYPPGSVHLPLRLAPLNMPTAATDCGGGRAGIKNHSSFELWEQYSFNTTGNKYWNGWNGLVHDPLPESWATELKRFYLAAVSHTDFIFGQALQAIEDGGDSSSTIVAVVGDHGWQLGECGLWAKCTNFESATRAPFMIHVPGVTDRGIQTTRLSEHVDIMPTLAGAVGIPLPVCPPDSRQVKLCTEGINLLPYASDSKVVLRKASFSQWPHPFNTQTPGSMGYSIRTEQWRYTEWVLMNYTYDSDGKVTNIPDFGVRCARELYNLTHPGQAEKVNLADYPDMANTVAMLSGWLHAGWRAARGNGSWPTPTPAPPQRTVPECVYTSGPPSPSPPPPPPPPPPSPMPPITPCMSPGQIIKDHSRSCVNATAQGHSNDHSCWASPAVIPASASMKTYEDCAQKCVKPECYSWTFSAKGGCFMHSTQATYVHPSGRDDTWCSCNP